MEHEALEITGVLAALVTPMNDEGVDEGALRTLVDRLAAAGVTGVVPCGSTGEFAALSHAERRRVTEVVVEAAAGRVHVIPHTGAMRTDETIELSRHAQSVGATAVLVIPPYYEPPPFAEVVDHFERVARAIDIPIAYYNIPVASGLELTAPQMARLAEIESVRFVKNSSLDAALLQELVQTVPEISVWNGQDSLTLFALLAGTDAVLWGAANIIPELCVDLFRAVHDNGDIARARALWARLWPLCHFLETGSVSYSAAIKAGCELVGHPVGAPRLPVGSLAPEQRHALAELLEAAGAQVVASGSAH
jgi:4-hydroxy-tetrahydrodipicolinate synthase